MPFDLNGEAAEATRFYFGADREEWVDLRIAQESDIQTIRDEIGIKTNIMVYIPNPARDNELEMVPEIIDPDKVEEFTKRLNAFGIPAWRLMDKGGNEIPYSPENVNLMIRKSRKFADFVQKNLKKLRKDQNAELEAELKNS